MKTFVPRHLPTDKVDELFLGWLRQAEVRALEAWINYNLHPDNRVMHADWEQARENLSWLEGEYARCRSTYHPA